MKQTRVCNECGVALPTHATEGLCPKCLLRAGVRALGVEIGANQSRKTEDKGPRAEFGGQEVTARKPGSERPEQNPSPAPVRSAEITDGQATQAERFGDYELLEKLGQGGMGMVYKARQVSLGRLVALKVLPFGPFSRDDAVRRFRAEAAAVAALQHPNIVAIHEVGEHAGQHYYAMDFVEGRTLAQIISDFGFRISDFARSARWLKTIAEAIHSAHQRGIIHRDLKPSNILIDQNDQPRITDFGLAKRLSDSQLSTLNPQLTLSGQVLGSPNYLPPEQARAQRGEVGPASDVYSLGAVLYHLVTGRPPFQADSLTTLLRQVIETEPVAPRLLNASLPRDLETICLKCLEKEPGKRYATAELLAEDLGRFLEGKPVLARPLGRMAKVGRWCGRNPVRAGLTALVIAVFALGSGGVVWQWRRAEQARLDALEKLWQSCLAQAQANRWSGRAGRRFAGLEAIRQATAIRPNLKLRNEAIACLALPDARVQGRLPFGREARILGFAIDAGFERYALGYGDSSISIRRAADRSELMKLSARGTIEICGLLFSPQGKFLTQQPNDWATVPFAVWDLSQGRLAFTAPFVVRSQCFTSDDGQLALAESAGKIHFYDLATGTEVSVITVAPTVNNIVIDPTGERLAISREESPTVLILDLKSQSVCASLTDVARVGRVAWSPDGSVLACPCGDERLYLWNVATGERKVLQGHVGVVTGAIFNRLGDLLVSTGWDAVTWFWDPKLGLPLFSLPGGWVQNGFDPNDQRLGFGVDVNQFGIWEVAPARECRRLGQTAVVWGGAFSADGRVLATASSDGVRLWQVPLNRLLAHLPVTHARSAIWHPNGTNLITSGSAGIQLWPVEFSRDATEVRVGSARQLASQGREQAQLTADGHFLVAASSDNPEVLVLDLEQPSQPKLLNGHVRASFVSFSLDGKWFATGTWHGTAVKIWSLETCQTVRELPVDRSARCIFSPDGRWLWTGSPAEYCLWRVGSWEPGLRIPRDRTGDMYGAMALSPDGRLAALLHERNRGVKLVSIPDGRELAELDTGEPLCFSQDGSQLATTGADHRTLLVWDLRLIRNELRALKLDWD